MFPLYCTEAASVKLKLGKRQRYMQLIDAAEAASMIAALGCNQVQINKSTMACLDLQCTGIIS
jgi:hypothetical protein